MSIPSLQIGDKTVKIPILQGGMGIGVSLSRLAAAVANAGGIGVMAGVQIGYEEADFYTNNDEANVRGLRKHIRKAKELSPDGFLGVNIMVAVQNYREMVQAAVEEKIDLIISGAGLPSELPALVKGSGTKIAPIVSSGKAAALIAKMWDRKYQVLPDLVIVEGPDAGGHLGFSEEQLQGSHSFRLDEMVKDVMNALKQYEEKYRKKIPVIAAGGVFDGNDIADYLKMGAAGVQMATRFVATQECDADEKFKQAYINSQKEEIGLVKSPVGMPGRAILNEFVNRLQQGAIPVTKCTNCLKPCNPATTPYCITEALIRSVTGSVSEGLIFAGKNAYRINKIVSVQELMNELVKETEAALST
ncbi:NAD(P)H-dependent flavin oxidoreductase YrpB, nitropropane dioxygenase family [Tindallia magadiensis]|uniref:Probable nitronate monooxygenase n=1 Tax=Tindallia magadiensis TaxID=69895 RepID=A0A1I3DXY4_9FIRM|nr:nitronate monooxygenase family protein [Tindallia magadiensis]SFH91503.1 NAD(P)H-dependent flavin oxidoreductase YrpB, nitropropane dioxygenase family [Tindallia magadiensis]